MVTYPKDWTEECLENITSSIITGGTPSTTNQSFWGGTIPWLASAEIHQKRITRPTTYITDVGLQNSSAKIAPKNSVLIALAGQGKTRGTAAFLQHDMAINQSLAALVVNAKADPEFLFHSMETSYTSLREISSGDGGRGGLNKKLLKKYTIVLPTNVLEQEAIAETLSCMDEHIANLTELIEKKKAIRDGALEDLVSGRTRLDGFSSEWKDANIGSITSEIITGGTPSTTISSYWGGTIPWLASTEIHQKRITRPTTFITESGIRYSAAKIAPKDSVLIALAGQGKTRGTAAFLAQDMAINQSLAALVVNEKADANFLFYAMERSYLRLRELSSGDGGRGGLNKKLLKQFVIPFTLDTFEQKAIADILITIDIEIVSLEEEKDKMMQIKSGAMDDLLTGRVRLMRQGG